MRFWISTIACNPAKDPSLCNRPLPGLSEIILSIAPCPFAAAGANTLISTLVARSDGLDLTVLIADLVRAALPGLSLNDLHALRILQKK